MYLRHQRILLALKKLGGVATTRQIAKETGLSPNGTSQSLKNLAKKGFVTCIGGKAGQMEWKLLKMPEGDKRFKKAS